ncbi:retrovirus-related Pol polyprotein from type-1 retrotransposable element R2 [Caerostris extrusa]|uniref:Retrovirus-related Pol polyprotein from type-1 retrotransposable element R2 n=1 Tax=Caerostris extrusa TaxID=172846 RepID=A0AAV4X0J3_CAEEX|nr:retrovirus-related Pol polyprotein from type-1 retrotransposable element R2 [Caerostris extrusa]
MNINEGEQIDLFMKDVSKVYAGYGNENMEMLEITVPDAESEVGHLCGGINTQISSDADLIRSLQDQATSSYSHALNIEDPQQCQKLYKKNRRKAIREIRGTQSGRCSIPPSLIEEHFSEIWQESSSDSQFSLVNKHPERDDVLGTLLSVSEVSSAFRSCENTAPGPDRITYKHWRSLDPRATLLTKVFNCCIHLRTIPLSWKASTTILLPKSGDRGRRSMCFSSQQNIRRSRTRSQLAVRDNNVVVCQKVGAPSRTDLNNLRPACVGSVVDNDVVLAMDDLLHNILPCTPPPATHPRVTCNFASPSTIIQIEESESACFHRRSPCTTSSVSVDAKELQNCVVLSSVSHTNELSVIHSPSTIIQIEDCVDLVTQPGTPADLSPTHPVGNIEMMLFPSDLEVRELFPESVSKLNRSVPCCRSNYDPTVYISCFQFPKEEDRKNLWLKKINRKDYSPSKNAVVCIKHFSDKFVITEDHAVRDDGSVLTVRRIYPKSTLMHTHQYFQISLHIYLVTLHRKEKLHLNEEMKYKKGRKNLLTGV